MFFRFLKPFTIFTANPDQDVSNCISNCRAEVLESLILLIRLLSMEPHCGILLDTNFALIMCKIKRCKIWNCKKKNHSFLLIDLTEKLLQIRCRELGILRPWQNVFHLPILFSTSYLSCFYFMFFIDVSLYENLGNRFFSKIKQWMTQIFRVFTTKKRTGMSGFVVRIYVKMSQHMTTHLKFRRVVIDTILIKMFGVKIF